MCTKLDNQTSLVSMILTWCLLYKTKQNLNDNYWKQDYGVMVCIVIF